MDENVPEGATLTVRFGQVLQPRIEGTSIITPSSDLAFSAFDILLRLPLKDILCLQVFKMCSLKRSDDEAAKKKKQLPSDDVIYIFRLCTWCEDQPLFLVN